MRQVRLAEKSAHQELERWRLRRSQGAMPSPADAEQRTMDFVCHACSEGFALRKHLGAHIACTHKIWSLAWPDITHWIAILYCHGCHTWLGNVKQVQFHLKRHEPKAASPLSNSSHRRNPSGGAGGNPARAQPPAVALGGISRCLSDCSLFPSPNAHGGRASWRPGVLVRRRTRS